MGEITDKLLAYSHSEECYTVAFDEVRDLQIAAMNERLQERIDKIKLVKFRAEQAGITEIQNLSDVVPLLLPHTAYKSYPESFLIGQKWDKLSKWLGSVATYPTNEVDLTDVVDIDDWIGRLEAAGHPVSCSSGTSGKSAMLVASKADIDFGAADVVRAFSWGTSTKPNQDRGVFALAPVAAVPRNRAVSNVMASSYSRQDLEPFTYPVRPITIGSITRMVALRKAVAEGTAVPAELTEYEKTSSEREKELSNAVGTTVDALLKSRGEKLFLLGMWASLYAVAAAIREQGYSGKDFHSENMLYVGGGLKGAQVPDNYQEIVCETFNVAPERNFQFYGMQELNTTMPRCPKGRYHIPPWLVCVPLNKEADALVPGEGEVQCRAGFFDLSLDGRWGGVISGDRIDVDYSPCACGAQTPSIKDGVVRYADLKGDDKINCSGTVDAYVRGM